MNEYQIKLIVMLISGFLIQKLIKDWLYNYGGLWDDLTFISHKTDFICSYIEISSSYHCAVLFLILNYYYYYYQLFKLLIKLNILSHMVLLIHSNTQALCCKLVKTIKDGNFCFLAHIWHVTDSSMITKAQLLLWWLIADSILTFPFVKL